MGWRGALRSYQAAVRREERNARAREREAMRDALARQRQQERARVEANRQEQLDLAAKVAERYEMQLELLTSLHRECNPPIRWDLLATAPEPPMPDPVTNRYRAATTALESYKPGLFARLFGSAAKNFAKLREAVESARAEDEAATQTQLQEHDERCRDVAEMRELAAAILEGDTSRSLEALLDTEAFEGVNGPESSTTVEIPRASVVAIEISVPTHDQVVPTRQESLTAKGKLSSKAMPKTKGHELYQDFVAGTALRLCREAFAALPCEWVVVTVRAELLDPSTGHTRPQAVLSFIASRASLEKINFKAADASDTLKNFLHRMQFKKTGGMAPIEPLVVGDIPG